MFVRELRPLTVVLVLLVVASLPATVQYVVRVECGQGAAANCPAGSTGLMLISTKGVKTRIRSTNNVFNLSSIDSTYTQAMAFRAGYKPAYRENITWTTSPIILTLEDQVELPIRFWAICPDNNGDCTQPLNADQVTFLNSFIPHANSTLLDERVGIRLVEATGGLISDGTRSEPGAADLKFFGDTDCSKLLDWINLGRPRRTLNGAINIYLVSTVDNSAARGSFCASAGGSSPNNNFTIALAASADWTTILHEIGHTLSLPDLPRDGVGWTGSEEFQKANFMYSATDQSTRQYFTEGQIYRIFVQSKSAAQLMANPSISITRYCGGTDANARAEVPPCPLMQKRVWPEH